MSEPLLTSATAGASMWVTLRGDFSVPLRAVLLALELDEMGYELQRVGDKLNLHWVGAFEEIPNELPKRNISATERNMLRPEVRALVVELKKQLLEVHDYVARTSTSSFAFEAKNV